MQVVFLAAGLLLILAAAGCAYQMAGAFADRRHHAAPGRWLALEGLGEVFLLEQGSGSPSVVFESGIAATHLNWRAIQTEVAGFASTVSYDRLGLGWSSRCTSSRTPANLAAELRAVLTAAGIAPPFILVGHSFGGLILRSYASAYPEDVAGLVLVDPMRIEEWPPLNAAGQASLTRGLALTRFGVAAARLGLARLAVTSLLCGSGRVSGWLGRRGGERTRQVLKRISEEVGKMPAAVRPAVAAHWSRPEFYRGMRRYLADVPQTIVEMEQAEPLRGIPTVVLTPARAAALSPAQLAHVAEGARQIIAPASAHWIHLDEPGLVIDAIRAMLQATTPAAAALIE